MTDYRIILKKITLDNVLITIMVINMVLMGLMLIRGLL